jgi:hypothetical protein
MRRSVFLLACGAMAMTLAVFTDGAKATSPEGSTVSNADPGPKSFSGMSPIGGVVMVDYPRDCFPRATDAGHITCEHHDVEVTTATGGSVTVSTSNFQAGDPTFFMTPEFDLLACRNDPTADAAELAGPGLDNCTGGTELASSFEAGPDTVCFDVAAPGGTFEIRITYFDADPGASFDGTVTFSTTSCAGNGNGGSGGGPTPAPEGDKFTGGGKVMTSSEASFAQNVFNDPTHTGGKIRYQKTPQGQPSNCRFTASKKNDGYTATFTREGERGRIRVEGVGTLDGMDGTPFVLDADDNDQGGDTDTFTIHFPTRPGCDSASTLTSGNQTYHQTGTAA